MATVAFGAAGTLAAPMGSVHVLHTHSPLLIDPCCRNPRSEVDHHVHHQQAELHHHIAHEATKESLQNIGKRSSHHPLDQLNGRDLDRRDLSTTMTLAQGINGLQKAGNLWTKSVTTRYSAGSKILNNMAISSVIIELVPKRV